MKKFLFLDDTKDRHDHFDSVCAGLGVEVWHVWNAIQAIRMLFGNYTGLQILTTEFGSRLSRFRCNKKVTKINEDH